MINILIPMGGKSFEDTDNPFPKPLLEINGKPMIERVLAEFKQIKDPKRFIFILKSEDCDKYHLDKVLTLVTDGNCIIVMLRGDTKGAVCSSLMAIDHINNDDELIISNADQIIEENLNSVLKYFRGNKADAGVICFNSVHPKYSYAKLTAKNKIIETAEKSPISRDAIAGFYYFKRGRLFVESGMRLIEEDNNFNGLYYIAPTYNWLVLMGLNLLAYKIDSTKYHIFYSPSKIRDYENFYRQKLCLPAWTDKRIKHKAKSSSFMGRH